MPNDHYIANKKVVIFVLAGLIFFHLISNYIWCLNDWITTEDDMTNHLLSHLGVYQGLKQIIASPEGLCFKAKELFKLTHDSSIMIVDLYPPLFYFTSACLNIIFNTQHIIVTRLSNMLFFSLLIISVYFLGKASFGPSLGLAAAALVSFYPALAGMSRLYTLDFPLSCVTAFAVYALIRTDYFSKLKESVFFGLIAGSGFLIKGQFAVFIIGPTAYALIKGVLISRKNGKTTLRMLVNFIVCLFFAAAVSSIWWFPMIKVVFAKFLLLVSAGYSSNKDAPTWMGGIMNLKLFSPDWLFSYVYFFLNNISPVLFILFLLGLAVFVKLKTANKGIILAWLLVPYIVLTFYPIKKDRYFMPDFAAIALISMSFFYIIKTRIVRRLLIVAFMVFAAAQLIFLSFLPLSEKYAPRDSNSLFYIITPMHDPEIYGYDKNIKGNFYECVCRLPCKSNIEEISSKLLKHIGQGPKACMVASVGMPSAIDFGLVYILKSCRPDMQFYSRINNPLSFLLDGENIQYDYIIVFMNEEEKDPGPKAPAGSTLKKGLSMTEVPLAPALAFNEADNYLLVDYWSVFPGDLKITLFRKKSAEH